MTRWKYSLVEEAEVLAKLHRQREERDQRAGRDLARGMLLLLALLVFAGFALAVAGCDAPLPLPAPAASADAASAPAGNPHCTELVPHNEFVADGRDGLPHVFENERCLRACANTAGGLTCVLAAGGLAYCEDCQ